MAEGRQAVPRHKNIFRLGVEMGVVFMIFEVMANAVLFSARDAKFDFEADPEFRHTGQKTGAFGQIIVKRLGGEIEHMRGKERRTTGSDLGLAQFKKTLNPGNELAIGVIGMKNDADAILTGQKMHMMRHAAAPSTRALC